MEEEGQVDVPHGIFFAGVHVKRAVVLHRRHWLHLPKV